MLDLNDSNARQCRPKLNIFSHFETIRKLDAAGPASSLLLDNLFGMNQARQEKRVHARRDGRCDPGDQWLRNGSRPARHLRHQPDGRGTVPDSHGRLFLTLDTANLYPWNIVRHDHSFNPEY